MVLIQVGMVTGGRKKIKKSAFSPEKIKIGLISLTYGKNF
jgi:hypothetical protein